MTHAARTYDLHRRRPRAGLHGAHEGHQRSLRPRISVQIPTNLHAKQQVNKLQPRQNPIREPSRDYLKNLSNLAMLYDKEGDYAASSEATAPSSHFRDRSKSRALGHVHAAFVPSKRERLQLQEARGIREAFSSPIRSGSSLSFSWCLVMRVNPADSIA